MTTFATVGKKVDDHIAEFGRKVSEVKEAFEDSIKTSDRKGFERAVRKCAYTSRAAGNETIAVLIEKILYTPEP